nr:RagB/SusD family nutrient uptake outer membrane protein [uncultured Pedobacter sp.]
MKKNISVIILLITGLTITSCKKFLDTEPTGVVAVENYFKTEKQVDAYLASVYDAMNMSGTNRWYGSNYQCYVTQGVDESYARTAATTPRMEHYSPISTDIYVSGFWGGLYIGIERANTLLEYIDQAQGISEVKRKHVKAEAKFLRAYYHFMLTQWWGDIPLRTKSTTSPDDAKIAFTPTKDVYDWVINEMTEAEGMLEDQKASSLNPYYAERITYTTVQGMLARVCLYAAGNPVNETERYAEALEWANKVIASNEHKLNPSYDEVFRMQSADQYDATYKESMWEVGFALQAGNPLAREAISSATVGIYDGANNPNGQITSPVYASAVLYRAYDSFYNPIAKTDNSPDLRRDRNVSTFQFSGGSVSVPSTKAFYTWNQNGWWLRWPGKWRRAEETFQPRVFNLIPQNWPILRYADVLLMMAEADNEVHDGPSQRAIDAINQIRRRGYGESTGKAITLTLLSPGSGYTLAPSEITAVGGNSTETASIGSVISAGAVTSIQMSALGRYQSLPSKIYLGSPWIANTSYLLNTNVVVPATGRLYRVTRAGLSSTTAPAQTSGATNPANAQEAIFTYLGEAATATATYISADLKPDQYKDKNAFKITVQKERMLELCYEGFRKQDLKRWGLLITKVKERSDIAKYGSDERFSDGTQKIPPIVAVGTTSATLDAATIDGENISVNRLYLPIPLTEITNNSLAKQNPGY